MPPIDIQIDRMSVDHLAAVLRIENDVFHDPWSQTAFFEVLSLSPHNWVALVDGAVVGYLISQWVLDEVHILNVAVAAERQRHGIGRELLAFLVKTAAKRGMRDLFLEVRICNRPAITLYEHFGFEGITVRKGYYIDGEDALVMHRRLPAKQANEARTEESDVDTQR